MSETYKRPNYAMRRLGAAGLLALGVLGTGSVVNRQGTHQEGPAHEVIAEPGDTITGVINQVCDGEKTNLSAAVYASYAINNAGERVDSGRIMPGDKIVAICMEQNGFMPFSGK